MSIRRRQRTSLKAEKGSEARARALPSPRFAFQIRKYAGARDLPPAPDQRRRDRFHDIPDGLEHTLDVAMLYHKSNSYMNTYAVRALYIPPCTKDEQKIKEKQKIESR